MLAIPSSAVSTWGGAIVFLNVLVTRLGVPVPAVPVLLFAGSAIAAGTLSFWPILCAAVLGALIGDGAWFTAGRLYGRRLLAALGRLSPAVDSKVDKARSLFERFGVPLVSISKFVPGLGLITPPLMGTTAVDARIYAAWELASAAAWATFWLLGGAAAERELHMLLALVRSRGGTVIDVLAAVALVYLMYRLLLRRRERLRFAASNRQADADGVAEADAGSAGVHPSAASSARRRRVMPPMVLDARPAEDRPDTAPSIPWARCFDPHSIEQIDGALLAHDMVIYCVCPDSATAVEITQRMRVNGYTRIRALRGGLEAWQRRGFPVEPPTAADDFASARRKAELHGTTRGAITLRGLAPRRGTGA